jgi:hypothetical protein
MRGAIRAGLAATLILIPQLAAPFAAAAGKGPVSSQPYVPPPAPPAPPPDPNPRLLTPTEEGRQDLVHGPGEQPLRDFNLIRSKIPPVLLEAMNDAYARPYPSDCQALAAQVRILSDAIGPDLDEPVSNANPSLMNRGEVVTRDATLDALREAVTDTIPFHSWVRLLTGAQRHDQLVLAAITAGAVRRAYLKGLGEARGCAPPGVPRHLAHPSAMAAQTQPKPTAPGD